MSLVPSFTLSHSDTNPGSSSLSPARASPYTGAHAHFNRILLLFYLIFLNVYWNIVALAHAHLSLSFPSLAEHHMRSGSAPGLGCFHSAGVLPHVKSSLGPRWLSPPTPCEAPPHPQSEPLVPLLSLLGGIPRCVPWKTTQPPGSPGQRSA